MTLDCHPLIVRTVASLKPNTAEARCMTTREGSRASRYGAKDAGSLGRAVSSALPTVDLFRPCPPRPSVPAGSHSNRMSGKCPSGGIGRRSSTRTPLWLRLLQQLLELFDDHLGELAAGVIAMRLRAGIVQFHLIEEKAAVRRAFASRSAGRRAANRASACSLPL
jgi:hypothetical protein